jgi:hypothetical protein
MPRNHKNLLLLQVRGKILWFENNCRCVILALQQGREVEHLQWFMNELHKDICILNVERAAGHKNSKLKLSKDVENLVKESLEQLRDHPQSLSPVYLTSRRSFRVSRKKDKGSKIIRVKAMKRKQDEALEQKDHQPLKRQFSFVVQACIEFLESAEPGAAASSNEQPELGVPEEAGHAECAV